MSVVIIAFTIISMCTLSNISHGLFKGTNNCKILIDDYDDKKGAYDDKTKKKKI